MPVLTMETNRLFFELFVDDLPYKRVEAKLFKRDLLLPKSFDSMDQLDFWFDQLEYKLAKNYLLFLLGKQDYLSTVLKTKLSKRLVSKKTQEKLLENFVKLGYVDDKRVVKQLVNRYKLKKSIREIKCRLKKDGIDLESYPDIYDELLKEGEKEAIEKLVYKNRGKDKQKLKAYLFRKGFSVDAIKTLHDLDI